jgi:predicted dehydrogenase
VCDTTTGGQEVARSLAPGVMVTGDWNVVTADSSIEGVFLATPAATHRDLAILALRAGKDVFVEKPLALNHREGLEMQAAAAEHRRILMVGHLLEYHPAIVKLCELKATGVLGKVNYIYSNRLNFGKIRIEENALWSFAPHDLSVILRLLGEMPLEVTCVGGSYVTPNLADVSVSNILFPSGVRAHIFVSWLNPFKEQKLVVVGEQKMAVFDDVQPRDKLVLYDQRVEVDKRMPFLQKGDAHVVEIADDEPLRLECQHFLHCVQTRQQPLTSAERGIEVLRILQASQRSLELNGRPVLISEIV